MSKRFNLGNSAVHILPALFFLIPYISSAPTSHSQTYEQFMNYVASKNCVIPGITNIFINCSSWNCLSFPLKECNTVEAVNPKDEAFMLCHEIFENLEFIACQTNNTVVLTAENFHFSTEVCKDFANIAPAIPKRENYLGRRLEDEVVCNIICADKFEYLCKTLLWSYEIRNLMEDYLQKLKNVEKKLDIDEQRKVDQEKKFDSNRQSEVNNEHANGILESKDKLLQNKQENDQKLPQSDVLQEDGQSALLQSGENPKFSESSNPDFHLKGEAEYSKDRKHNDLNLKNEEIQPYNGKENKAKSEPNQLSHETKSQRFEAGNSSGKEILGSDDKLTHDVGLLDGAVSYKKNKEQMLDGESKNVNSNLEVVDIKQNEITDDGSVKPSQNGKSGKAKVVKSTSEQIHDKPSESKVNEVLDVTSKPKEASHKPISVVPNQLVSNEKKVESDQHQDEAKLPVTQNDSVKVSSKDQTTGGKSQGKKVDSNLLTVNTQPGIGTNASLQGEKDIQNNSISSSLAFENTLKPDSSTLEAPLEKMEDGNVPQNMNKDQDQYNDIENDDDDNEQGEYSKPDYDGALYHSTKSKDIDLEAPNSIDLPPSEIAMEKSENPKSIDKFSSRNSFGRGPDDIQMISSFPEQEDSHFFFYFLSIVLILMAGYLIFHNKQKIIALIVEGRHERRRRSHGVGYKKLETK